MKKAINAYQVNGTKDGWNYPTFSMAVRAENEEQAILKASKFSKDNQNGMKFIAVPLTIHHIQDELKSDSYPYGRDRTTATFSIEYSQKKGCRTVFQTVNPKNGRINAPKKSTYSPVILPCTKQNGHFDSCLYLDFNGTEAINKGLQCMADFYECFTEQQIKDIAAFIVMMSKVNAKAQVIYAGTEWEQLKPLVENSIQTLVKIAKTGENLFTDAFLDIDAIEALKKPNYNPFKVVSHHHIG